MSMFGECRPVRARGVTIEDEAFLRSISWLLGATNERMTYREACYTLSTVYWTGIVWHRADQVKHSHVHPEPVHGLLIHGFTSCSECR